MFLRELEKSKQKSKKRETPKQIKITNEFLYSIGFYIAEGWLAKGGLPKYRTTSVCNTDRKKVEKVMKNISNTFGGNFNINYYEYNNVITGSIFAENIALQFQEWCNTGAKNKKFPDWVFSLSKKQVRIVLQGYYDGDGYKRKNTQQASTISSILVYQLCILEGQLNNPVTIRDNRKNPSGCWSFEYSIPDKVSRDPLIKNITKNNQNYILYPIEEVSYRRFSRKTPENYVYDLTIADDESFVVGLSTVHNCHRIGSTNTINIISLITKNTVDNRIENIIKRKLNLAHGILDDNNFTDKITLEGLLYVAFGDKKIKG